MPSLLADPHVTARGDVVNLADEAVGSVAVVAPVPRLSATPGTIRTPGPALGAHNREVYAELLGLSDEELVDLSRQGVV